MRFAYSTNIFRLRPLAEAVEGIAKGGFGAVEIIADHPHALPEEVGAAEAAELSQLLEKLKMKVCNLNSSFVGTLGDAHNPSWLEEDWQHRERRIRYTLDCLRLAAAMGIPHVSTMPGGPIPDTMNQEDAWRLFVANMHRVLPLAKKIGAGLLIDPSPEMLIETSEQALAFLKEFEFNEYLRINFDVGHFFSIGEDPCSSWEKLKPYTLHVHLDDIASGKGHRHVQLGEGAVDIPSFLDCVRESGYEGYVTIKLDSYDQRAEEAVLLSAHYLQERGFLSGGRESGN